MYLKAYVTLLTKDKKSFHVFYMTPKDKEAQGARQFKTIFFAGVTKTGNSQMPASSVLFLKNSEQQSFKSFELLFLLIPNWV